MFGNYTILKTSINVLINFVNILKAINQATF